MNPSEIIRKKRDGGKLSREEIEYFVNGVVNGTFADYQASALLMAIYLKGMDYDETCDLTMAMARSGDMLDLSAIEGVKVDKHSTGGVGDTTSLILVPLVAACGVKVAKMSGRGLGYTGGTLDKLESVKGLSVAVDTQDFIRIVREVGCAIVGQTGELAPADKILYALRDVTATVDCLPLITASILSKKIAAGSDVIVLDVKSGSGALMPTLEKSIELARTMVDIGNRTGRRFSALVTDMDQPLGQYVGNALEVEEAIQVLSGRADGDLKDVALLLGAHILRNSGACQAVEQGVAMLEAQIANGNGLKKLAQMFAAQGGDPNVAYDPSLLPKAQQLVDILASCDGYIAAIRTADIGYAAKALGAGRERKEDPVDLSVGLVMKKRIGDRVAKGDVLATLHVGPHSRLEQARAMVEQAFTYADHPVEKPPLVHCVIE